MYYINKLVGFVISPIGVAIVCGMVAMLLIWRKRLCAAKWVGGLTITWLWLWMMPIMIGVVGASLEREFLVDGRVPLVESYPKADAVVLLGGSMSIDTNLSAYAEMWSNADRVWQTVRLYKAEKADKIIATGDDAKDTTLPLLKDFGVVEDAVSFVDARNTEEEAKGIAKLGLKKVLLVTSAWHMKRARLMFKKYAPEVEVICAPTDFEYTKMARLEFLPAMLLPDPYALAQNSVAFHEWLGIIGYLLLR